jgi:hypothetical protein
MAPIRRRLIDAGLAAHIRLPGKVVRRGIQFETAFSSLRAWSIWAYAYVTMAAVVLVSPLRASDA